MLDSKQCSAFLAVSETGSFDQAGLKLNITASAVSLRVQALERTLGKHLILRERPCKPTPAGQKLKQYLNQIQLLEQNLKSDFSGKTAHGDFFKAKLAINADSLATWLLPALYQCISTHRVLLDIQLDDQEHTHHLLQTAQVNACISTQAQTMQDCETIYLGNMRYSFVASQDFYQHWFSQGFHREALKHAPAIIFNAKDHVHHQMLLQHFGLPKTSYPCHFIPSSESFLTAIELGLGYGMVPSLQLEHTALVQLSPHLFLDIPLYWHHWQQQSQELQAITQTIQHYCKKTLAQ